MRWTLTLIVLVTLAQPAAAELAVNNLFSSQMVLQRDAVVPVWGTATPGAEVTVAIAGLCAAGVDRDVEPPRGPPRRVGERHGRAVSRTALLPRFRELVGGDEVAFGKPAPDIYLEAARRLGASAGACLVLEDSEPGVRAALAAGMMPIMVPASTRRPRTSSRSSCSCCRRSTRSCGISRRCRSDGARHGVRRAARGDWSAARHALQSRER